MYNSMDFLGQVLNPNANTIQLRHEHQHRRHNWKRPTPRGQEPLHGTMYQKYALFFHSLHLIPFNISETMRIPKRPLEQVDNIEFWKIRFFQIEEINNPHDHPTKFISIGADHRSNLGDRQGLVISSHANIGASTNENIEPITLAVLTFGDCRDHSLDVVGFGGRKSQPKRHVVDELSCLVDFGLFVAVNVAGAGGADGDEGAGGAVDAAILIDQIVVLLEPSAGGAGEVVGDVVADEGLALATDADGHVWVGD